MPNIRAVDMLFLDGVFEMHGGYVLNFSDRTFAQFFHEELSVNIDDPKYAKNGTSKGRRFKHFLQISEVPLVVRTLNALWEFRGALRMRSGHVENVPNAESRFADLIRRLQPGASAAPPPAQNPVAPNKETIDRLKQELFALPSLEPQPRGYAFERFLKALFDTFGLEARDPFRIKGEQIDGSFLLANEIYLLEAKWQSKPCDASDLRNFQGKIEEKTAWTRGLFISNSGFTEEGLTAFGRGKRVVCMDGYDLYEILTRDLSLPDVLHQKVRRAGESGELFVRARSLFPM